MKKPGDENPPQQRRGSLSLVGAPGGGPALLDWQWRDLRKSGLTDETVRLAGLACERDPKRISEILHWSSPARRLSDCLAFPYFDYRTGELQLIRLKPHRPRTSKDGKTVKYESPVGQPVPPYLGPRCRANRWLESPAHAVVYWIEGEKKLLLADQLELAAIGVAGVFMWHDVPAARAGEALTWSPLFRPIVDLAVPGRDQVIVFDADSSTNPQVRLAMRRLAGVLLESGARSVSYVEIPPVAGDPKTGLDDFAAAQGEAATRALLEVRHPIARGAALEPEAPQARGVGIEQIQALQSADLPRGLRLPDGYQVRPDASLWRVPLGEEAQVERILPSVIVPVGILRDARSTDQLIEIRYLDGEHWRTERVDRKSLKDPRRLVDALPAAAAVTALSARHAVEWIDAFVRFNERRLPSALVLPPVGWHVVEGERIFMLGEPIARPGLKLPHIEADDRGEHRQRTLAALRTAGSPEAQLEAMRTAWRASPAIATAICAALAAPMLERLAQPNFAVHLYGPSSRGKSTGLEIAASIYGNPATDDPAAFSGQWLATGNALEAMAEARTDVALCLDEAGMMTDPAAREDAVYRLCAGHGKGRLDRSAAMRSSRAWRTVVISSGELLVVRQDARAGAHVRVLQLHVDGIGSLGHAEVAELKRSVRENYGHPARRWLAELVAEDDWGSIREHLAGVIVAFGDLVASDPLSKRQAAMYAVLHVVERLAHRVLGLGNADGSTMRDALLGITGQRLAVTPEWQRALGVVHEHLSARPNQYPVLERDPTGKLVPEGPTPPQVSGYRCEGEVWLLPLALRQLLGEHGLDDQVVLAEWRRLNLLKSTWRPDANTSRPRIQGRKTLVITLDSASIEDGYG